MTMTVTGGGGVSLDDVAVFLWGVSGITTNPGDGILYSMAYNNDQSVNQGSDTA